MQEFNGEIIKARDGVKTYMKILIFSVLFCLVGLTAFYFFYQKAFRTEQEYQNKLEQKNYIISKENNPNLIPFFNSQYVTDLYSSYNNNEINENDLNVHFKKENKKTKSQKR